MKTKVDNCKFEKSQVAACVIFYNTAETVIDNINSYINQIDHLYIIDNSEQVQSNVIETVCKIHNVSYTLNDENKGIAFALNQAARLAIEAGYIFLLTMDDDTAIPANSVERMLSYYTINNFQNIGIVAGQSDPRLYDDSSREVGFTITSGSLINLHIYGKIGPFKEELFIDFVDHEYCYRLIEAGYKIFELNYVHLKHRLGQKKILKLLGIRTQLEWNSHNPVRIFYKTRNSLFIIKDRKAIDFKYKYPFYKELVKDFLKIVFLEDKKIARLSLFVKAISHASIGKLGKYTG